MPKRFPRLGTVSLSQPSLPPDIAQQITALQTGLTTLGLQIAATMAVPKPEPEPVIIKPLHDEQAAALRDPLRILRDKEVAQLCSVSWPTIWRRAREGKMPKPIKLGKRVTGWRASEIAAWMEAKAKE
jgi:prophage regulatory protein